MLIILVTCHLFNDDIHKIRQKFTELHAVSLFTFVTITIEMHVIFFFELSFKIYHCNILKYNLSNLFFIVIAL